MSGLTFVDAMNEPLLFGPSFSGSSWEAMKMIWKAAYGLPMSPEELVVFGELGGGRAPPTRPVKELWIRAGRRTGKDSVAAAFIIWKACFEQAHLGKLRPGERAVVLCLATDRTQAKIIKSHAQAYFTEIPALREMIVRETQHEIELNNGVDIVIATND